MLVKIKNLSEMTTILKVVLCSLLIVSCSKFEEEQKQTTLVPNINEAQAIIGGENIFEDYVNIEDFKNQSYEDLSTYDKHENALYELLAYKSFPSVKSQDDLHIISKKICEYYSYPFPKNTSCYTLGYTSSISYLKERTEPYVECFIKFYSDSKYRTGRYKLFLPREIDTFRKENRDKLIYSSQNGITRREIPLSLYCSLTGIPEKTMKDLRVVTRQQGNISFWYYQMPYKDNYKDYQNDTQPFYFLHDLKQFIKKGSLIFVFDKPLEDLYKIFNPKETKKKGDDSYGFEYWGHMLIVSDWYTNNTDNYMSLNDYEKLDDKQDFQDINSIHSSVGKYYVSFKDYLKHFVFIEAQKKAVHNKNKMQGFERDGGVMLTVGNDKRFQEYIDNATCIAVVNINEGYNYSHPDLVNNMIKNAYRKVKDNSNYNLHPTGLDNDTINHYCSGLAYYSLLNGKKAPSLRLLKYKHISNTVVFGYWYMPRTVCNSPFVYTRVWYKRK